MELYFLAFTCILTVVLRHNGSFMYDCTIIVSLHANFILCFSIVTYSLMEHKMLSCQLHQQGKAKILNKQMTLQM